MGPLALWTPEPLAYFRASGGGGILASGLDGFFRACEARRTLGAAGAEGLLWNAVTQASAGISLHSASATARRGSVPLSARNSL